MSVYENYNIQIGLSDRTEAGAALTQQWLDLFRSTEDVCASAKCFFAFLLDGKQMPVPACVAPNQFHVMQLVCEIYHLNIPAGLYEQLPMAGDDAYGVEFYNAEGGREYRVFGCARVKALDTLPEGMDWYLYDEMQATLRLPRQKWCELMGLEDVDADAISSWEDWTCLAENLCLPFPERGEELECVVSYFDEDEEEDADSLTACFDVPMYPLFEKCSLRQLQEQFDATVACVARLGGELRLENVVFDEEEDGNLSMAFSCLDYYILTFKSTANRLFDLRVLEVVLDTPDRRLLPYRPEYSDHLTQVPPAL